MPRTEQTSSWTTKALIEYVAGLSNASKMPGYGYSLPAADCIVGGRLRSIKDSTCSKCYAHKGNYRFGNVQAALRRRAQAIVKPLWVEAMAELISRRSRKVPYFRWHDSGDLQSVDHLARICAVADLTPQIAHWLPTREYRIVSEYVESGGAFPDNLCVRMSAHMIGGHVPTFPRLRGLVTVSTVSRDGYEEAHECPARHQDNHCGDCRSCWDRDVEHVDYHLH